MSEHTPGPWQSHGAGGEIHGDSRVVATMTWCSGMNDEDEANACLIAAAPDLLHLAQEIIASNRDGTWAGDQEWFFTEAREVIAKATGK